MSALGDTLGAIGAFAAIVNDPATADEGDLADVHQTEPYRIVLDPDAAAARRSADRGQRLGPCASKTGQSATWNCPLMVNGTSCTAAGNGTRNGDGTYSGMSTQTCPGGLTVQVNAMNVVFDETAGRGGGSITVRVALAGASIQDWAVMTITDLGFCLNESPPKPNAGRIEVDGRGRLDGLPFDPVKIRFSGDPVCGTALLD